MSKSTDHLEAKQASRNADERRTGPKTAAETDWAGSVFRGSERPLSDGPHGQAVAGAAVGSGRVRGQITM